VINPPADLQLCASDKVMILSDAQCGFNSSSVHASVVHIIVLFADATVVAYRHTESHNRTILICFDAQCSFVR
jgi:hypothetical protein